MKSINHEARKVGAKHSKRIDFVETPIWASLLSYLALSEPSVGKLEVTICDLKIMVSQIAIPHLNIKIYISYASNITHFSDELFLKAIKREIDNLIFQSGTSS